MSLTVPAELMPAVAVATRLPSVGHGHQEERWRAVEGRGAVLVAGGRALRRDDINNKTREVY